MPTTLATARYTLRLKPPLRVTQPSRLTAQSLGRKIAELRRAHGLSQEELGRLAGGVPQTTISGWENAAMVPNVIDLLRLAEAFEISPATFLEDHVINIKDLPQSVAEEVQRHADAITRLVRSRRKPPPH